MAHIDQDALLRALAAHHGPPALVRDIARALRLPPEAQASLRRVLRSLAAEGRLDVSRGPRYALAARRRDVAGRLVGHPSGIAFVTSDGTADILIPASRRAGAVHGDLVVARVESEDAGGRLRGRVVAIQERRGSRLVGRLRRDRRGVAHVAALDPRLDLSVRVAADDTLDAGDGDVVTVEVAEWPGARTEARGRVVEVLGAPDEPGVDTDIVLRSHGIPDAHSPDAVAEARARDHAVQPDEAARRTDFRHDLVVTIDGEHARDFDDAISVVRLPSGLLRLSVHIADVAHYVPEGGALDLEAYDRATSVYFPDRAVHMFPPELATGACSLQPHVDRLVQSCVMDVDAGGEVVHYTLHDGVIHSRARMTYTAVNAVLAGDPKARAEYAPLVPAFERMRDLFEILNARRRRRGSIDFDLPEAEVVLGPEGEVADIVASERNVAHRLIEEFMLLANETVAAHLLSHRMPALYRVHEPPDPVRVAEFQELLAASGLTLGDGTHPRQFQTLVARIHDTPLARPLAALMLRTLQKARYDPANLGHFGLAAPAYTHFTSPIRRYPDLVVHRVLRELRQGRASEERRQDLAEGMAEVAQHTSAMERRALEAEREVLRRAQVRFMASRLGDTFTGIIAGVASFGAFVQLDDPFVEGLIPLAALAEGGYRFDGQARALVGGRGAAVFGLGATVRVQVVRVDLDRGHVELRVLGAPTGLQPERPRTGAGRGRTGKRPASRQRPGKRERAGRVKRRR
ncbi:MAG: ribonuclease R [Vicinamibacterales bacterium]